LDINNILGCFFILCGVLLSQLLPLFRNKKQIIKIKIYFEYD
jgi:hypothetical protein